jgi:hypothetical protein
MLLLKYAAAAAMRRLVACAECLQLLVPCDRIEL